MTESRPRGLETRERRVDCRTRGFPCAYAYGLCYTVQGLHLQFDMGTIQEERLRRGPPPHFTYAKPRFRIGMAFNVRGTPLACRGPQRTGQQNSTHKWVVDCN